MPQDRLGRALRPSAAKPAAFVREALFRQAVLLSVESRMLIILLARSGDADAMAVLRELILEMKSRRLPLPLELENYNMELVHGAMGHKPPGPQKRNKVLRDICITMIVGEVIEQFRLELSGRSARRRSACSIVAEALGEVGINMGPKAVEKICERYSCLMPTRPGWPTKR
jgi:hypothetical protein